MSDFTLISLVSSPASPDSMPSGRTESCQTRRASREQPAAGETLGALTDRLMNRLRALPDSRAALIASVRARIAAGTYETPAKIDAAVRAMSRDLDAV